MPLTLPEAIWETFTLFEATTFSASWLCNWLCNWLPAARLLALPPARWGCRAVEVVELCALGAENPFCGACGDYNFHKELFILYRWLWRL